MSCAGGACATCHIPVEYENAEDDHSVVKIIVEVLPVDIPAWRS